MVFQKNDFIEIEFTGRIKGGEVFDSNVAGELKKLNPNAEAKLFIFSLGNEMFLEGIDDFLIGKNIGKYEIELSPEKAFGRRSPDLIQRMPTKVFFNHKLNPVPGTVFNFDNKLGKILAVSGGRVIVDFNNPLAGKDVVYTLNVLRKIDNLNEKINSLNEFFFRRDFEFEVKENKLILKTEKKLAKFLELFKEKYKEILSLDLEIEEIN